MFQDTPDSSSAFQELGQPEEQPEVHLEVPEEDDGDEQAERQGLTETEEEAILDKEREAIVSTSQHTVSQPPGDQVAKLGDQSGAPSKRPSGNPADTATWRDTLNDDFMPNLAVSAD